MIYTNKTKIFKWSAEQVQRFFSRAF